MKRSDIKIVNLINYKLWFSAMVIAVFFMLSSVSYAFWSQNFTSQQGILLKADKVTYFDTLLNSDNIEDIIPSAAVKNSLADNNLSVTDTNIIEKTVKMTLISNVFCNILINFNIEYKNQLGVYENLPVGVINCEMWCDFNIYDSEIPFILNYSASLSGYCIENFAHAQTGSVILKISFTQADELTDPIYKQTAFKINLSFQAIKQAGG